MNALNEFQWLLVIASAILALCAVIDLPPVAPRPSAVMADSSHPTYAVAKSLTLAIKDGCVRQRTEGNPDSTDDGCNDR